MTTYFNASTLCYASAAATLLVAVAGALRARRGLADWTFVLGLLLLTGDRLLAAFSLEATTLGAVERWQQWRMLVLALLPGTWLIFSLTYARLNAGIFLRKWRFIWPAGLVVPPLLVLVFREDLFRALDADRTERWILDLATPATALFCVLLLLCVLVLANLERTFRASVGTMRWRIKFMLLGVGILFVTEIYATSQAVLYHSIAASMETLTAIAVFLAMIVLARHLLRTTRFENEVYPSQAILEGSIILGLSAAYLLGVGIFTYFAVLVYTYFKGEKAGSDPWDGRTLEWAIPSPPPEYNFKAIPTVHARDAFWYEKHNREEIAREQAAQQKADEAHGGIHMPDSSIYPFVAAVGVLFGALAFAASNYPLAIVGVGVVFLGTYLWALEGPGGYHIHLDEQGNETIERH